MKIRDIALWILFIIAIAVFLWYIFGNSPTFEQSILILIITILFAMSTKIVDVGYKLDSIGRRFNKMEDSFIKLANDFKETRDKKK